MSPTQSAPRSRVSLVARVAALLAAAAFAVAGCSNGVAPTAETVTTTASAHTTTKKAKSAKKTLASQAAAPAASGSAGARVPEKPVKDCIFGGGNWTGDAIFTDGTSGPASNCRKLRDDFNATYPYTCPRSDAQVKDPADCRRGSTSSRPSTRTTTRTATRTTTVPAPTSVAPAPQTTVPAYTPPAYTPPSSEPVYTPPAYTPPTSAAVMSAAPAPSVAGTGGAGY